VFKDIAAFFQDPAVFRKSMVALAGFVGVAAMGCSQQIAALAAPKYQPLVIALGAILAAPLVAQMHNSGESK
jgi:hypothetical protein